MRWHLAIACFGLLCLPVLPAVAGCGPEALGTSRILPVGTSTGGSIGLKSYPRTLDLEPGEVVLTFDDGPVPGPTRRVLDALAAECVQATFFVIGRNAAASPALLRRMAGDGHTVGTHSMTHALLDRLAPEVALADIDRGIATVAFALEGDRAGRQTVAPFFRFPGFAASTAVEARLATRGIIVFGADIWASDWDGSDAQTLLTRTMTRLRRSKGGILLLHDSQGATAAMIPALLRRLKAEGYRIVHVVPAKGPLKTRAAPAGWSPAIGRGVQPHQ